MPRMENCPEVLEKDDTTDGTTYREKFKTTDHTKYTEYTKGLFNAFIQCILWFDDTAEFSSHNVWI